MGNHKVGQMFVAGVSIYTDEQVEKMTQEEALNIVDDIGKVVVDTTSLDAEFDDHLNPNQKLGRMVIKSFHPVRFNEWKNEPYVNEEMDEEYYDNVYKPFRERFGFW